MNTEEDDYGCEEYYDDEDEKHEEYDLEEIVNTPLAFNRLKSQSSMIFLRFDEIKRVLDHKIEELEELLDLNYDEALILFHYFHWNRDKLENSDWFCNEEELRKKAGLKPTIPPSPHTFQHECPICFGEGAEGDFDGLKCGHRICKCCWESFINEKVNLKENEFFWTCPGQSDNNKRNCSLIVPDSFNRRYLKKSNEAKYMRKLCISYVEENKAIRWCPAPDCMYCIENPSLTTRTIRCKCSTVFCFRCGLEDHHPIRCDLAANWQSKNLQESENTKWVSVYTKVCPKCKRPIEKNQGCNHMTCKHAGCNFEFCWLCLEEWKTHQGSHYKCNKYEALPEEEKHVMNSFQSNDKQELEKYVFYFERFSNSERAFQIAKEIHAKMEGNVAELQKKLNMPYGETRFLVDATEILQRMRKVLKWTYPYAYYISNQKTKNLFEFHQKDLERYCEELSEVLEIKYGKCIQTTQGVLDLKTFLTYKDKVSTIHLKCQKFCDEFIRAVEDDFEKME